MEDDAISIRKYFDLVNNQLNEVLQTQQMVREDIQELPRLLMGVGVLQHYQLTGDDQEGEQQKLCQQNTQACFPYTADDQQEQQGYAFGGSTADKETQTQADSPDPSTVYLKQADTARSDGDRAVFNEPMPMNGRESNRSERRDSVSTCNVDLDDIWIPPQAVQRQASGLVLKAIVAGHKAAGDIVSWQARLRTFVAGNLDVFTGIVVVLNLLVMVVEGEYLATLADASLGVTSYSTWSPGTGDILQQCEYVFVFIYLIDLILRLLVLRSEFFYTELERIHWFNILDGCIVIMNVADVILSLVASMGMGSSATLSRMVKIARLSRVFRIVRTFKLCFPLRALVSTCIASIGALFWSMILLFLCKAMCALVLSQTVHSFIMDSDDNLDIRIFVNHYYGSFVKAMYTVFEITHSGSWPARTRPLVDSVSEWYALLFMVYITVVVFALVRIVTALFLKETLDAASGDALLQMEERKKAGMKHRTRLCEVFQNLDESGDGVITKKEFHDAMANPILRKYLSILGIDIFEVRGLFEIIDGPHGDGQIEMQEFCDGLVRLKGQARSIDMITLLHEGRKTTKKIEALRKTVVRLESMMGGSDMLRQAG